MNAHIKNGLLQKIWPIIYKKITPKHLDETYKKYEQVNNIKNTSIAYDNKPTDDRTYQS